MADQWLNQSEIRRMKTITEMVNESEELAEDFFYSDDEREILWEPFEDYPPEWIAYQKHKLSDLIYDAMVWALSDLKGMDT